MEPDSDGPEVGLVDFRLADLSTVFLLKNCPGQRNRELPWAILTLKLAMAIFAIGFSDFLSGLETLADRSGSKNAFERNRNQPRRPILRPFHGTFSFSPKSVRIAVEAPLITTIFSCSLRRRSLSESLSLLRWHWTP